MVGLSQTRHAPAHTTRPELVSATGLSHKGALPDDVVVAVSDELFNLRNGGGLRGSTHRLLTTVYQELPVRTIRGMKGEPLELVLAA
jgi:hypothetical protein